MSKEPIEYLKHIQDESIYLLSLMEKGLTREQFLDDDTLIKGLLSEVLK